MSRFYKLYKGIYIVKLIIIPIDAFAMVNHSVFFIPFQTI